MCFFKQLLQSKSATSAISIVIEWYLDFEKGQDMGQKKSFWNELGSRHVIRSAVAHLVFFWLQVQVVETVLPYFGVVNEPS